MCGRFLLGEVGNAAKFALISFLEIEVVIVIIIIIIIVIVIVIVNVIVIIIIVIVIIIRIVRHFPSSLCHSAVENRFHLKETSLLSLTSNIVFRICLRVPMKR